MTRSLLVNGWVAVVGAVWGCAGGVGVVYGQDGGGAVAQEGFVVGRAPSVGVALRVFPLVRGWITDGAVPEGAEALVAGLDEGKEIGVGPVAVTVRLDGKVLARGTRFSGGGSAGLVEAVREAVLVMEAGLPAARDAAAEELVRAMRERAVVSVEFGGPLVPLRAKTFGEADVEVRAGAEGVAVELGGKVAGLFPEQMRVRNDLASAGLQSVVSERVGDATAAIAGNESTELAAVLKKYGGERGGAAYRFAVTHVAQVREGGGPVVLLRGSAPVTMEAVSIGGIDDAVNRALEWQGRSWSAVATEADALGLYAEARALRSLWDRAGASKGEERERLLAAVRAGQGRVVRALKDVRMERPGVAESALVVGAKRMLVGVVRGSDLGALDGVIEKARGVLGNAFVDGVWSAGVPTSARGIAAWGVSELVLLDGKKEEEAGGLAEVRAMCGGIYAETPAGMLVSQMPWIVMAERNALELGRRVGENGNVPNVLHEARDVFWSHQVRATDVSVEDLDLVGGVAFTVGRGGEVGNGVVVRSMPTWQMLRPFAGAVEMLRDPGMTEQGERVGQLSRAMAGARFVMQLQAGDAVGVVVGGGSGGGAKVVGGVRAAVWDQRQPREATSLAIVGLVGLGDAIRDRGLWAGMGGGGGGEGVKKEPEAVLEKKPPAR